MLPYEFEGFAQAALAMYKAVFELTPYVEGLSCDECFALMPKAYHSDPLLHANQLRSTIEKVTGGCTASIGVFEIK